MKPRQSHRTIWCTCFFWKHDVYKHTGSGLEVILHVDKLPLYFLYFLIFSQDHLMILFLMKFLIAVFLEASPFINFGDFCQPPRLLHPPVCYFGQNLPASPFIPPSPSVWNSRVGVTYTYSHHHTETLLIFTTSRFRSICVVSMWSLFYFHLLFHHDKSYNLMHADTLVLLLSF